MGSTNKNIASSDAHPGCSDIDEIVVHLDRLPCDSYFDFCYKPNLHTESWTRANVVKDDAFLVLNIKSSGEDPCTISFNDESLLHLSTSLWKCG